MTCVVAAGLVVQLIIAELVEMLPAATLDGFRAAAAASAARRKAQGVDVNVPLVHQHVHSESREVTEALVGAVRRRGRASLVRIRWRVGGEACVVQESVAGL